MPCICHICHSNTPEDQGCEADWDASPRSVDEDDLWRDMPDDCECMQLRLESGPDRGDVPLADFTATRDLDELPWLGIQARGIRLDVRVCLPFEGSCLLN